MEVSTWLWVGFGESLCLCHQTVEEKYLIESVILGLSILNIYVIYRVFKCALLEHIQKIFQILIVLILPFLGALIIFLFVRNIEKDNEPPSKGEFGGGPQNSVSSVDASLGAD